uniref:Uncharacterized protein n=1 Tax=Arcella intermedia TaxID=1963864 RepID=A0A6B2LFC0_9EUKA
MSGINNLKEFVTLQTGTSHQKPINVGLLSELHAVLAIDATTIDDADLVGHALAHVLAEVLADLGVDSLGNLRGGHFAGANGPHGFVGNHHRAPLRGLQGLQHLQLRKDHLLRLPGLPLRQGLAAAEDHPQAALQRKARLLPNHPNVLLEDMPPLRVPQDDPLDPDIAQLLRARLAREGPRGVFPAVLRGERDVRAQEGLDEGEIDVRRGHQDLSGAVLGEVDLRHQGLDGLRLAVQLPIASHKKSTTGHVF